MIFLRTPQYYATAFLFFFFVVVVVFAFADTFLPSSSPRLFFSSRSLLSHWVLFLWVLRQRFPHRGEERVLHSLVCENAVLMVKLQHLI